MKDLKKIIAIAFLIAYWQLSTVNCFAQNIGINQTNPDNSALLDMTSSERGLLIPRVDLDDVTTAAPVTAPVAEGLLIYNETGTEPHGFYYWDGSVWKMVGSNGYITAFSWTDATNLLRITEAGTNWDVTIDNEADNVTLTDVQNACTSDFHNIGGTDAVNDVDVNQIRSNANSWIQGDVTLQQGTDITLSQSGDIITINSTGGSATCGHTIGESYDGGIVFYVSSDGCHGLISETQDQYTSEYWDLAHDRLSDPSLHSTEGGKYFDWRLPSKWELNQMYIQSATIGGFASANYWCSTESHTNTNIWYQNFGTGAQASNDRTNSYYVRAVRVF